MANFVLTYNPLLTSPSLSSLGQYIKDSRDISSWHSPWLGTYLFKADKSTAFMQEKFRGLFMPASFFIAEVFPHSTGGYLSPEIWQWFNFGTLPALPDYVT